MKQPRLSILPPAKHLCQICAIEHAFDQPHNPQSFYYQYLFGVEHGRSATWRDAMAHCSEETRKTWIKHLELLGIDIDSPNIKGDIQSTEDVKNRLKMHPPK